MEALAGVQKALPDAGPGLRFAPPSFYQANFSLNIFHRPAETAKKFLYLTCSIQM
jgi:hypothetical protein